MKKKDRIITESLIDEKLKDFPRKDDLKQVVQDMSDQIYDKLGKIQNTQDKILKELVDMRDEDAAGTLHFDKVDKTLNNYEKRLTALESS